MKTRYILYPLLMLLAILLPTSCSTEEDFMDSSTTTNGDKITFTMGVSVPGASNVQSRAFADGDIYSNDKDYFKSANLHIAVFEISSTGTFLKEFVSADPLEQTDSDKDNDGCTNFRVTLTQSGGVGKSYRLHVIANYPGLELIFDNEVQLMSSLGANGADHDVYWNFVELNEISQTSLAKLLHVPLVRNYAKISLNLPSNLGSFAFTGYKLYNVPKRGTVAAYNPNATSKFTQFVATNSKGEYINKDYATIIGEKYVGNEPYNDGSLYGETGWITIPEEQTAIPSTYMYERRQTDISGIPVSNTTFMIIRGTWGDTNTTVYYKLDFTYTSNGNTVYYNLLRNFHYTMSVSAISGPGYTDLNEAIRQPACNNISASAELKDFTNISNGESQLYVSTTYVMFTNNTPIDIYYKYIPKLTDKENGLPKINNTNVSITPQEKAEPVLTSATPATEDENDGQYEDWRKVTLTPVGTVPSSARLQKVTISAGGLSRTIELEYRQPIPEMSVVVNNNELVPTGLDTEIPVQITLPADIPVSLFPLRLFITSADNTIFPAYGANMPAEVQSFKDENNAIIREYGFIREVSLSEYQNQATDPIICDFIPNSAVSATTVFVKNQYLATASDAFENEKITSITIGTNQKVNVQTESYYGSQGFYPERLNNNNTESVTTIKLNGTTLTGKSITIDRDNVTVGTTIESATGFNLDDVLTFTFSDKYCTGVELQQNGYPWTLIPTYGNTTNYTATCTVADLLSGKTLDFDRPR